MMTMTLFQVVSLTICLGYIGAAKWQDEYPIVPSSYLDTVVITCLVNPATFTGIYKGNQKLETDDRITVRDIFAEKKVELEIKKTVEEDHSTYYCKDGDGDAKKTIVVEPTLAEVPKEQKAAIGFQGIVHAFVHFMPKKPITWKLNDKEIAVLSAEGNLTKGGERYNILPRGSLIIKKTMLEDAGEYTISVKALFGYKTRSMKLLVGKKPVLQTMPEKVYTVTVGLDLKIPCEWVGAAKGPLWSHTSKMSVYKKITGGFDVTGLTLVNVTTVMEGNYTCEAQNEYGNSSITSELKYVIIPTAITTEFKNESKVEKTAYNLTCGANGTPQPLVTLSKVGGSVLQKEIGIATYTFTSLSTDDKGTYICQADNGAKKADGTSVMMSKSMTLDILTIPVIKKDTTMTTDIVVSAVTLKFKIQCSASSNPNPTVKLMKDNKDIATNISITNGVVTAYYEASNAVKSDFGEVECIAMNDHGKDNYTITIKEVVKAPAPTGLTIRGDVGLEYIDLMWEKVESTNSYIVYVNDTLSEKQSPVNEISITELSRNTYYSFKVASVNIAGVGNASESVTFKTSDILVPDEIQNFQTTELSSSDATVTWSKPLNVRDEVIIYYVTYCIVNSTKDTCKQKDGTQDTRTELADLQPSTTYEIFIQSTNQNVKGGKLKYQITTLTGPTEKPYPSGKKSDGLSAGAVAGVIIAVILIIMIVVDLFCCYFNHCGFSHCCFESFCAAKGSKKYAPADTKDAEDEQELKAKTNEYA